MGWGWDAKFPISCDEQLSQKMRPGLIPDVCPQTPGNDGHKRAVKTGNTCDPMGDVANLGRGVRGLLQASLKRVSTGVCTKGRNSHSRVTRRR